LHFYSTNHEAEKEKTKTLRGEWRRKMKYIRVSSEETSSTARSSDGVEVNIVKHAGHILVGEVHLGGEGQMEDQVREWSRRGGTSRRSPSLARIMGPGTLPLKVQNS